MPTSPSDAAGAVASMRAEFEAATQSATAMTHRQRYQVAGRSVSLTVVGQRLADEVMLPLSHLLTSHGAPTEAADLTIEIWDQAESGVGCGALRNSDEDSPYYNIEATDDGRFVRDERNHHVAWLDRDLGRIVAVAEDARLMYLDERARPLRRLLSVWLQDIGIQLSHCGLVSSEGRGVLFVGNQGAGKTTSSMASFDGGLHYLGDDFVGIGRDSDGGFRGFSLYASCLLNRDHLRRFPDLQTHAREPYHEHELKSVIYLANVAPDRLDASVRINAVVMPRVVDTTETSFRPVGRAAALLALAPTAVMFLTRPEAQSLQMLGDLVERVPCYLLELGRDVGAIPRAVQGILKEAGRA